MEQITTNGRDSETSAVKIAFPHQVMIEKWMLVLLIVSCTSILFLICFPIDFCLYRRRKRHARERKNSTSFRPQLSPKRLPQSRAKVTDIDVTAEIDLSEINKIEQRKYHAQKGVIRFLNMLKQKTRETDFQKSLTENTLSDGSSDFHIKPTQDMKSETANAHTEIYSEMNGSSINHVYSVNEITKSPKEKSTQRYSYDDDYLDYSPEKRFSKSSKARRNENQEPLNYRSKRSHLGPRYDKKISQLDEKRKSNSGAHHKKKRSRFVALEPLENMTNIIEETSDYKNMTIPNSRRNEESLTTADQVGDRFIDISDNKFDNEHIMLESNTVSSATKMTESNTDAELKHDYKSKGSDAENGPKDVNNTTAKLFQTVLDIEAKGFKNHKVLRHSQSEQCIIGHIFRSTRSQKKKRKGNVVSPISENTFSLTEQIYSEENTLNDRTIPISIPIFTEYAVTPEVKRKIKKKTVWKKQSSDSMPELHYKKEKY